MATYYRHDIENSNNYENTSLIPLKSSKINNFICFLNIIKIIISILLKFIIFVFFIIIIKYLFSVINEPVLGYSLIGNLNGVLNNMTVGIIR